MTQALRSDYDAVVIGAGPAGGVAALGLARAGRRVLLVDKQRFPRPKVCGCCLNASALATLRRVGVGPRLDALRPHAIDRLVMRAGARAASLRLPGGLSLSRPALDGMLVDAAVDAGATFCDGVSARVAPPAGNAGGHHVALNTDIVRARCVVVADGLAGTALRDWPSMASAARPDARVGLGVHLPAGHALTAQLQANAITMLCGRRGYLGMVRLEHGGIDLAAAADRDALKDHGGAAPLAQAIAADAGVSFDDAEAWPWRLTPPLTRSRSRLAGPGLFVVGDAAGYVEPFTGEGMAWALAGGAAVVSHADAAVDAWNPSGGPAWSRAHRRTVARRQRGCRAVAALLRRPRLTRAAVGALAFAPVLAAPLVPGAHRRGRGVAV